MNNIRKQEPLAGQPFLKYEVISSNLKVFNEDSVNVHSCIYRTPEYHVVIQSKHANVHLRDNQSVTIQPYLAPLSLKAFNTIQQCTSLEQFRYTYHGMSRTLKPIKSEAVFKKCSTNVGDGCLRICIRWELLSTNARVFYESQERKAYICFRVSGINVIDDAYNERDEYDYMIYDKY